MDREVQPPESKSPVALGRRESHRTAQARSRASADPPIQDHSPNQPGLNDLAKENCFSNTVNPDLTSNNRTVTA